MQSTRSATSAPAARARRAPSAGRPRSSSRIPGTPRAACAMHASLILGLCLCEQRPAADQQLRLRLSAVRWLRTARLVRAGTAQHVWPESVWPLPGCCAGATVRLCRTAQAVLFPVFVFRFPAAHKRLPARHFSSFQDTIPSTVPPTTPPCLQSPSPHPHPTRSLAWPTTRILSVCTPQPPARAFGMLERFRRGTPRVALPHCRQDAAVHTLTRRLLCETPPYVRLPWFQSR